ncbi:MAG: hypothetical protein FWF45_02470 [Coriobacteriia bacterium]|nr:hypothetical protein [Coriobacteriia bacterium]
MLGKLIKYEFKATARWFLPAFGVALLFGLVGLVAQVAIAGRPDWWVVISTVLYGALILAFLTFPLIMSIWHFNHDLLTDRGYLMFTLPVTAAQLLWTKVIVATVWQVLSVVVALVSTSLVAVGSDGQLPLIWRLIAESDPRSEVILLVILIVFGVFGSVLMYFTSLAFGQLFNKHRIAAALGASLVLYMVTHIIAVFALITSEPINKLFTGRSDTTFLPMVALMILYNVGYFLVTRNLLTKKLNLV